MGGVPATHLLDTHAWIDLACGERVPPLVERTVAARAGALALADISLWEAAKLTELGRLRLAVPLAEFFRLAITPELTVLPVTRAIAERPLCWRPRDFPRAQPTSSLWPRRWCTGCA
jgi:PIN domain nuclease of toxin-antitoxin system